LLRYYIINYQAFTNPQHGGLGLQSSLAHNLTIKLDMSFLIEGTVMSISAQGNQMYVVSQ